MTADTRHVCAICRCGHEEHAHDPDGCNGVPHAETCKCQTFDADYVSPEIPGVASAGWYDTAEKYEEAAAAFGQKGAADADR